MTDLVCLGDMDPDYTNDPCKPLCTDDSTVLVSLYCSRLNPVPGLLTIWIVAMSGVFPNSIPNCWCFATYFTL